MLQTGIFKQHFVIFLSLYDGFKNIYFITCSRKSGLSGGGQAPLNFLSTGLCNFGCLPKIPAHKKTPLRPKWPLVRQLYQAWLNDVFND